MDDRHQLVFVLRSGACGVEHELDRNKVSFRRYRRGAALAGSWCLCQLCEDAYQSGEEDRAVARMMVSDSEWNIDWHMAERTGAFVFDLEESAHTAARVPGRNVSTALDTRRLAWPVRRSSVQA